METRLLLNKLPERKTIYFLKTEIAVTSAMMHSQNSSICGHASSVIRGAISVHLDALVAYFDVDADEKITTLTRLLCRR